MSRLILVLAILGLAACGSEEAPAPVEVEPKKYEWVESPKGDIMPPNCYTSDHEKGLMTCRK